MLLIEYHSSFSLLFHTQCPYSFCILISACYFSQELTSSHFVFMWFDTSPRSRCGPTSQVLSIHLVSFFGHGDYFRIGTDLHQSKVNLRTFPKQLHKGPFHWTRKVRRWVSNVLEPSWVDSLPENKTQTELQNKDAENSPVMILFEPLDLALPEANIFTVNLYIPCLSETGLELAFSHQAWKSPDWHEERK